MARIYFHSPSRTAEVAGSERYHADILCNDNLWNELGDLKAAADLFRPYLSSYFRTSSAEDIRMLLRVPGALKLDLDGQEVCLWDVALNTAIAGQSEGMKLLARLHGQCELHCWVDGPNRSWLADVVRSGRLEGVLRADMGWEELIDFLLEDDKEPVVCSYSVCDSFPNFGFLPESHRIKKNLARDDDAEAAYDAFYRMRWASQWKHCMEELRGRAGALELHPETWSEVHFGNDISAHNLRDLLGSPERLARHRSETS